MNDIPIWNRLSMRLSLLILIIVIILAAATAILLVRGFDIAQRDALEQLTAEGIEVSSDVGSVIRGTVVNLFAVFLLTLVGATVFSRNLLTEPINSLAEATQEVASGKLGLTLPINSKDELGVLASNFNQMSLNLAHQTKELINVNEALRESEARLEQRVEERTEELMALLELSNSIALTTEDIPLIHNIFDELHDITEYQSAALFEFLGGVDFEAVVTRGDLSGWEGETFASILESKTISTLSTPVGEQTLFPIMVRDKAVGLLVLEHDTAHDLNKDKEKLVTAFASQAGVALENTKLYADVQERAAFDERQHLARELHDSVSQALYSIVLGSHAARKQLESNPEQAEKALEYVQNLAEAGLAEMRALIFELRPEVLEQEGLNAALSKQVEALEVRHNLVGEFSSNDEPTLSFSAKQALFRIVQEALHNIVKHAKAEHVWVSLEQTNDAVHLSIRDDGIGFDTEQSFTGRLGLKSMRERTAQLGGVFDLNSTSEGTSLAVEVPL